MTSVTVIDQNLQTIRKKRAALIQKIEAADNEMESSLSADQKNLMLQIREQEKQRDADISRLEREQAEFIRKWEKTREKYVKEINIYKRDISEDWIKFYEPTPKKLDPLQVEWDRKQLNNLPLFGKKAHLEMHRAALYTGYRDAVAFADQQIREMKSLTKKKIAKTKTDTAAQIEQLRKKHGISADSISSSALAKKKSAIAELGDFDCSDEMQRQHRFLENQQKKLRSNPTDWTVYRAPVKMPENLLLGSVQISFPARPDRKRIANDFGVSSWVRRDNETLWDLPVSLNINQSNIVILSSENSVSMSGSPDKDLARKLLCRMLQTLPPKSCAWSVLDPIHKGGSLGRLVDVAAIQSLELNFRLFSNRTGCSQEQKRLQQRPEEIIQAMAGRCSSLYDYNKTHTDSSYPFEWYVDFGFTGKHGEADPIRELMTTAQTAGTSFLFATTPEGAQVLEQLAAECCRTVPVICIDCDRNQLLLANGTRKVLRTPDGPDSRQLDAFAAAVKNRFTSDMKQDSAFMSTILKHKRFTLQPFSTSLSIPYALNSRKELVDLVLDDRDDSFAYICGKSGSGKSVLLHTLILSACMQYAPGALEVWLADYKLDELRHYHTHYLPQITLVSASKDPDISFSLLDRLEAEMTRRSALFARFPLVKDLKGYRTHAGEKGFVNVPVLLVIIDEFHIMSQALENAPEYKLKLENIFREGRAKGFRIVLADQTYSLKGLTEDARKQFGVRIAMRNDLEEIQKTLHAERHTYTEAELDTMRGLQAGDFIRRHSVNENVQLQKYHSLYATLEDAAALAPRMRQKLEKFVKLTPPDYVDEATAVRSLWDPQNMLTLDARKPIPAHGIRLYLGRGYTLDPCFAVDLQQEGEQCLSIAGGTMFQRWEVIRSVLLSCRRNGYAPMVFLPPNSDLRESTVYLRRLCRQIPNAWLLEDYSQWCDALVQLEKRMDTREDTGETVCLFLNLGLAAEDLAKLPKRGTSKQAAAPVTAASRAMMYAGNVSESASAPPEEETAFNAMDLIHQILKSGYRSNLYSLVEVGSIQDLSSLFRYNDQRFGHRIAFKMSADNAQTYLGKRRDFDQLPDGCALYSGGSTIYKLLPYQSPDEL